MLCFLLILRPPRSTRPSTSFPSPTLFRSRFFSITFGAARAQLAPARPSDARPAITDLRARPVRRIRASASIGGFMLFSTEHRVGHFGQMPTRALVSDRRGLARAGRPRSEEHTSELQSLMRTSYAVFCLKKKK